LLTEQDRAPITEHGEMRILMPCIRLGQRLRPRRQRTAGEQRCISQGIRLQPKVWAGEALKMTNCGSHTGVGSTRV